MLVLMEGPDGSGKSTAVARLVRECGFRRLDNSWTPSAHNPWAAPEHRSVMETIVASEHNRQTELERLWAMTNTLAVSLSGPCSPDVVIDRFHLSQFVYGEYAQYALASCLCSTARGESSVLASWQGIHDRLHDAAPDIPGGVLVVVWGYPCGYISVADAARASDVYSAETLCKHHWLFQDLVASLPEECVNGEGALQYISLPRTPQGLVQLIEKVTMLQQ